MQVNPYAKLADRNDLFSVDENIGEFFREWRDALRPSVQKYNSERSSIPRAVQATRQFRGRVTVVFVFSRYMNRITRWEIGPRHRAR
jgi:hypothetical protein